MGYQILSGRPTTVSPTDLAHNDEEVWRRRTGEIRDLISASRNLFIQNYDGPNDKAAAVFAADKEKYLALALAHPDAKRCAAVAIWAGQPCTPQTHPIIDLPAPTSVAAHYQFKASSNAWASRKIPEAEDQLKKLRDDWQDSYSGL
jgi:hypothetical protein